MPQAPEAFGRSLVAGSTVDGFAQSPASAIDSSAQSYMSSGEFAALVERYKAASTAMLGSVKAIDLSHLTWGAAEYKQFGEALRYCGVLETLELSVFDADAEGSAAVAAWVLPPRLKVLAISQWPGLTAIPALSTLSSLERLHLAYNPSLTAVRAPDYLLARYGTSSLSHLLALLLNF